MYSPCLLEEVETSLMQSLRSRVSGLYTLRLRLSVAFCHSKAERGRSYTVDNLKPSLACSEF